MNLEFQSVGQGVRMVLTFDAMHVEQWTQMVVMGWENQLGRLAKALDV